MKFAVLTNDLQYAAANKHTERKNAVEKFLPRQINFLKEIRELSVPVIHLQLVKPDSEENWHDKQFKRNEPGVKIIKEVFEDTDIIVEKSKDSGFFETELDDVLKKLEVDTIIITGMQAQICVQTTAADGYFRGYNIIVPSDVVVSTNEEDSSRALKWLEKYCAKVDTSDEIIKYIKENI